MNGTPPPADASGATPEVSANGPSWTHIVHRIRSGDASALEELYTVFRKGVRFYLCRRLGAQDVDDCVHEAFLSTAQAIRKGLVREPERLMGFVRTVVRRQMASHIETMADNRRNAVDFEIVLKLSDRRPDPERQAIEHQTTEAALRLLNGICHRDREVLVRFYLKEQSPREICRDLELTETQFRLIKSRAKQRFGELGQRRFLRRPRVERTRKATQPVSARS